MRLSIFLVFCVAFAYLATLSANAQATDGQATVSPKRGEFIFHDYVAPIPINWIALKPSSSMRIAQYRVPAVGSANDAEMVVFFFGQALGGGVQANINRWMSQFSTEDGKPVAPKTERVEVGGLRVTTVELRGNYSRGVGTGSQGIAKPNQTLLVAIIETPMGNLTFQLHGDHGTVEGHRKSFEAMIRGFGRTI